MCLGFFDTGDSTDFSVEQEQEEEEELEKPRCRVVCYLLAANADANRLRLQGGSGGTIEGHVCRQTAGEGGRRGGQQRGVTLPRLHRDHANFNSNVCF